MSGGRPGLLLDVHAHFQAGFPVLGFLDAALGNLNRGAAGLGLESETPVGLALADAAGQPGYAGLVDSLTRGGAGAWRLADEPDATACRVRREDDGRTLFLVRGQQLATAEGMEVLALAGRALLDPGRALAETCARAREVGAAPVLTWGFGKWAFSRAARVRSLLAAAGPGELLVADSGTRPGIWPAPAPLAEAARRGLGVVVGSDPLPLPWHRRRAGSCGSFLAGDFDPQQPGPSAARLLLALAGRAPAFARHSGLAALLVDQTALRARSWLTAGAAA